MYVRGKREYETTRSGSLDLRDGRIDLREQRRVDVAGSNAQKRERAVDRSLVVARCGGFGQVDELDDQCEPDA